MLVDRPTRVRFYPWFRSSVSVSSPVCPGFILGLHSPSVFVSNKRFFGLPTRSDSSDLGDGDILNMGGVGDDGAGRRREEATYEAQPASGRLPGDVRTDGTCRRRAGGGVCNAAALLAVLAVMSILGREKLPCLLLFSTPLI